MKMAALTSDNFTISRYLKRNGDASVDVEEDDVLVWLGPLRVRGAVVLVLETGPEVEHRLDDGPGAGVRLDRDRAQRVQVVDGEPRRRRRDVDARVGAGLRDGGRRGLRRSTLRCHGCRGGRGAAARRDAQCGQRRVRAAARRWCFT